MRILLVTDLSDDRQLLLDLRQHFGFATRIPLPQPIKHQLPEEKPWSSAIGRIEGGEVQSPEIEVKRAAIGDFDCPSERIVATVVRLQHLVSLGEVKVAAETLVRMRLSQQRQSPDALHYIIFPAIRWLG